MSLDEADPTPAPPGGLRHSRGLAAFLSFLIPGTGQFLTGRLTAGILFLLPVVIAVTAAIVAARGDTGRLVGIMVQPSVLLGIVVADGILFVWRAAAIVDAWWDGGSKAPRTALSTVVLVALLGITGLTHYAVGAEVMAARDTVDAVFASGDDQGDDGFGAIPDATVTPTATPKPTPTPKPGETPGPTPAPTPTPPRPQSPPPAPGRSPTVVSTCCWSEVTRVLVDGAFEPTP